jgi:hypothetical protein
MAIFITSADEFTITRYYANVFREKEK